MQYSIFKNCKQKIYLNSTYVIKLKSAGLLNNSFIIRYEIGKVVKNIWNKIKLKSFNIKYVTNTKKGGGSRN